MRIAAALMLGVLAASASAQDRTPLAATTTGGDKVLLHPNGRWEFVDAGKAASARQTAEQFPENKVRHIDAQGGWFGGRTVMPGDPDYNRGTLNPKMR